MSHWAQLKQQMIGVYHHIARLLNSDITVTRTLIHIRPDRFYSIYQIKYQPALCAVSAVTGVKSIAEVYSTVGAATTGTK